MAVLGIENAQGDFQVLDIKYPGLAPQSHPFPTQSIPIVSTKEEEDVEMDGIDKGKGKEQDAQDKDEDGDEWIAIVSGLEMGSKNEVNDLKSQLLSEYLLGELGSDQVSYSPSSLPLSRWARGNMTDVLVV